MRRQMFFLILTQFFIYFLISELDIFGGLDYRKDKATKIESQIDTFLVVFIFL